MQRPITWWDLLEKATSHKFLRSWRGPNGKMRYIYPSKGHRHGEHHVAASRLLGKNEHYKVGSSFSMGKGQGHAVIDKIDGDRIFYHIDELHEGGPPGPPTTKTLSEFKELVLSAHKEGAELHAKAGLAQRLDILRRAKKVDPNSGYTRRAIKELKRFEQDNGKFLSEKDRAKIKGALSSAEQQQREDAARKSAEARKGKGGAQETTKEPHRDATTLPVDQLTQEELQAEEKRLNDLNDANNWSAHMGSARWKPFDVENPESAARLADIRRKKKGKPLKGYTPPTTPKAKFRKKQRVLIKPVHIAMGTKDTLQGEGVIIDSRRRGPKDLPLRQYRVQIGNKSEWVDEENLNPAVSPNGQSHTHRKSVAEKE